MLGPESAYLFLDVYWLIFSGHILHICISRVMNRFGQSIIQLIKTLDVDDDLLLFLRVCHGFEQKEESYEGDLEEGGDHYLLELLCWSLGGG